MSDEDRFGGLSTVLGFIDRAKNTVIRTERRYIARHVRRLLAAGTDDLGTIADKIELGHYDRTPFGPGEP